MVRKIWSSLLICGVMTMMTSWPKTVYGQEVADTITIAITGTLTGVALTAEFVTPPQAGDTVIFHAVAVDEDGDPVNALITFFTEDETALRLEAITDLTVPANEGFARGIALRKATVRVWVVAEPIGELRLASFRDGDLNWSLNDTIQPGETLQYCAWLTRGTTLVAESPGPPACPTVYTTPVLPQSYAISEAMSKMDRRISRRSMARLSRGLPVNPNQG